jgi:hypothetical protein
VLGCKNIGNWLTVSNELWGHPVLLVKGAITLLDTERNSGRIVVRSVRNKPKIPKAFVNADARVRSWWTIAGIPKDFTKAKDYIVPHWTIHTTAVRIFIYRTVKNILEINYVTYP